MDSLQSVIKSEVKEEFVSEREDEEYAGEREDDFKGISWIKQECDLFSESGEAEDFIRGSLLSTEKMCDDDGFESSSKREYLESDGRIWKKEAHDIKVHCVRNAKVKLRTNRIKKRKKYACDICHMSVIDLKAHLLTHTKQTPYKCTLCKKRFSHRNSLRRHSFSHSGKRPYECSFCEQTFIERYHFKLHMNIHTGDRAIKCALCGKTFINKMSLRSHMNSHTEQRDFQCDVCKKEFKRKEHLQRHSLIHTGEKPYACASCDKCFLTKYRLQRHIALHE